MEAGNSRRLEAKIAGITPRHVHFQRQMAALCCKHFTTLLTLGVINSDAALTAFDEDNERDNCDSQQGYCEQRQDVDVTLAGGLERPPDSTWQTSDNTCKNQDRNAVTDPALSNLLTQPHHKDGTGYEGHYSYQIEAEVGIEGDALVGQTYGHTHTLNERQGTLSGSGCTD